MSTPIFKLAQAKSKDPSRCKNIDALQMKKYVGCFGYENRDLPIDRFLEKAKAPVQHLFNTCPNFDDFRHIV